MKNHRVSSAYHPHSNLRAETAVKSGKRLLMDNTRSDGSPDWDRVINALMQYRNTPVAEYNLSPSQLVFGRPIRDFLPIQPGQFTPSDVWVNNRETRELALRNRVIKSSERWSSGTKDLPPLKPVKFQRGDLSLYWIRLNIVQFAKIGRIQISRIW